MALYSHITASTATTMATSPRPPPLGLPVAPPPEDFLPPNMPLRLSCSLRNASSRSGGPFWSPPPPRRPPPPPPQGSWLFELPPGSFQAIALSIQKKLRTRHVHVRQCYRKPDGSGRIAAAGIIAKCVAERILPDPDLRD